MTVNKNTEELLKDLAECYNGWISRVDQLSKTYNNLDCEGRRSSATIDFIRMMEVRDCAFELGIIIRGYDVGPDEPKSDWVEPMFSKEVNIDTEMP